MAKAYSGGRSPIRCSTVPVKNERANMLKDSDKKDFKLLIDQMCDVTDTPRFTKDKLIDWWHELNVFTLDEIRIKIDLHIEQHGTCPDIFDLAGSEPKPKMGIPRTITPLMEENNKRHVAEVKQDIQSFGKRRDYKKWAHDILANPSGYPAISIKYAQEALNVTVDN